MDNLENRGEKKALKKEVKAVFDFNKKKENTICSLYEVGNFVGQVSKALKIIDLYKFFK